MGDDIAKGGGDSQAAQSRLPSTSTTAAALLRGFERRYKLDAGGHSGNDLLVRRHPNGLLVVSLAPSHTLMRRGSKRVASIAWKKGIEDECSTGKRCKGGGNLNPKTHLAEARLEACSGSNSAAAAASDTAPAASDSCSSSSPPAAASVMPLVAGVADARLVEFNGRLEEEPHLLQEAPEDEGFLVILQPRRAFDPAHSLAGTIDEPAFLEKRREEVAASRAATEGPAWAPAPRLAAT